jgi:hypothetical protein
MTEGHRYWSRDWDVLGKWCCWCRRFHAVSGPKVGARDVCRWRPGTVHRERKQRDKLREVFDIRPEPGGARGFWIVYWRRPMSGSARLHRIAFRSFVKLCIWRPVGESDE